MKSKDRLKDSQKPDRLDETNTHILREKVRRKDPNPGNPKPPSQ